MVRNGAKDRDSAARAAEIARKLAFVWSSASLRLDRLRSHSFQRRLSGPQLRAAPRLSRRGRRLIEAGVDLLDQRRPLHALGDREIVCAMAAGPSHISLRQLVFGEVG